MFKAYGKKENVPPKTVLGNKACKPHGSLFFLSVIYLEDCIGEIGYLTLTINALFSRHMFGLVFMSGAVILLRRALWSETHFDCLVSKHKDC